MKRNFENTAFENKKIIFIGDSHASFFSGYNTIQPVFPKISNNRYLKIEGVRLGSVLAYSLSKMNSTEKGREKFYAVLNKINPSEHIIGLCFGEIDCRCHIVKQAKVKNISIKESVSNCFREYSKFIDEILELKFKVILFNVVPTSPLSLSNPEIPHFGSDIEREEATKYFNSFLKGKANNENIFFLSIYQKLVKTKGRINHFFYDGVHLSQSAMVYICVELNNLNRGQFITGINKMKIQSILIIFNFYFSKLINKYKINLIHLLKKILGRK